MFFLRTLLAGGAAAALAGGALAQEIPIRPAGADGRFQVALDPKTRVDGFSAAQVARFRTALDGMTDRLVAMPEVNTPSAPLCMRVSSFIEAYGERGLVAASIDAHRPVLIEGRCSKMTGSTVQIWLNGATSLFTSRLRRAGDADGGIYVLPIISMTQDRIVLEDDGEQIEVFTSGRIPFLNEVTFGSYIDRQSGDTGQGRGAAEGSSVDFETWKRTEFPTIAAEMRRRSEEIAVQFSDPATRAEMRANVEAAIDAHEDGVRASMEAATANLRSRRQDEDDRNVPACWQGYEVVPLAGCPLGQRLVELNPSYLDGRRAGEVQFVLIRTAARPEHGEDATAYEGRRRIWDTLDRGALAAMVR